MPNYPWLAENKTNTGMISKKLSAMKTLGVPYSDDEILKAKESYLEQAGKITEGLSRENVQLDPESEMTALIAYMQRLGVDGRNAIKNNAKQ
jgi:cytochrome c oxidase cbb3-type subunit I/II